jgi:hypothetical protein
MSEDQAYAPRGRSRKPRRNAIVMQTQRYHTKARIRSGSRSSDDGDSRSCGQSSSWLPHNKKFRQDESYKAPRGQSDLPFENLLVQSLTALAMSAKSSKEDKMLKSYLDKQAPADRLLKPVQHHKDLLPFTELALLMSTELSTAKAKGSFGRRNTEPYSSNITIMHPPIL